MPKGIGYRETSKLMGKGRGKKKEEKTLVQKAKKDIKSREEKLRQALRDSGMSEEEIDSLRSPKKGKK